jgi:diacylglycerol kinase
MPELAESVSPEHINFWKEMRKWFNSIRYASEGVYLFLKTERNARISLVAACMAIFLSLWLQISGIEFCIILMCIAAVLSAEAFNTAIERLADMHGYQIDPRIKSIKDIAAGAVLIVALCSLLTGLIIFGPRIINLLGAE